MPLTEKRMIEIMLEETLPNRQATRLGVDKEEDAFRVAVRRDIVAIQARGQVVEIPTTQPDLTDPDENF